MSANTEKPDETLEACRVCMRARARCHCARPDPEDASAFRAITDAELEASGLDPEDVSAHRAITDAELEALRAAAGGAIPRAELQFGPPLVLDVWLRDLWRSVR